MGLLSLFGLGNGKIKKALRKGAIIIDVRSVAEYDRGHIPDALNIPFDRINVSIQRIKAAKRPVVLCCNSGTRSNAALQLLKTQGVKEIYNGGSWEKVLKLIRNL
jgi:rhodanese-related sulfurtransferase